VTTTQSAALIRVQGLKRYFPVQGAIPFQKPTGWVKAVDGVSFAIAEGETYSLVGETGCGKSTIAKMILSILRPTDGEIFYRDKNLRAFDRKDTRIYRTSVQAVFQDPWSSFNPRLRIQDIVAEPLQAAGQVTKQEVRNRVAQLLEEVGLSPAAGRRYPHEFSGGQRQRIAIARALSSNPRMIVLDEPVSSLDVSVRAQIMNLLKDVQQRLGVSYLLIAHDLATVRYLSHRVGVLYLGKLVEEAPAKILFDTPMHPYTKALVSASLPTHPDETRPVIVLRGEVPSPVNAPGGCAFHPRCPWAMQACSENVPQLLEHAAERTVACHLYQDASTTPRIGTDELDIQALDGKS
jgi:oligopeptide/dipeptide ABC transporter ATP-binding protein